MSKVKKGARWTVSILVALFLVIQLFPADHTNPPVESEVTAPTAVRAILRRACYDCHSNETVWPWYSWIAPISWQISRDVKQGRSALNFSRWNRLGEQDQAKAMHESFEEVADGEMPLWLYASVHPEASLSAADRASLQQWSVSSGSVPAMRTEEQGRIARDRGARDRA